MKEYTEIRTLMHCQGKFSKTIDTCISKQENVLFC